MYSGSRKYPTGTAESECIFFTSWVPKVCPLPHPLLRAQPVPQNCKTGPAMSENGLGFLYHSSFFPFWGWKTEVLIRVCHTGLSSSIVPISPSNEIVFASTRQQGPDIKTKRGPTTNRWPSSIHALYDITLRLMPCPALPSNMTDVIIYFNDTRIWWMCGILHDD